MKKTFEEQLEDIKQKQLILEKQSQTYSIIRALIFIFLLASGYFGYIHNKLFYGLCAILLLVFLYFIKKHDEVKSKITYCKMQQEVVQRYLHRYTNEWKSFKEDGEIFLNENFSAGYDLDIFGHASLFQYLNTASTHIGKKQLANWLSSKPQSDIEVVERQNAVSECMKKNEFSIHFEVLGRLANHKVDSKRVFESIEAIKENDYSNKHMNIIRWILPSITILAFVVAYISKLAIFTTIAKVGIFIQLSLTLFFSNKIAQTLRPVFALHEALSIYVKMFESLQEETFTSTYLQKQVKEIHASIKGVKALSLVSEMAKVRFNFIAHIIMSALFLWDFHCVQQLTKWKQEYLQYLPKWFEVLGNIEAICSLSVLAKIKEVYCFPTIRSDVEVSTTQMGHPLLLESTTVLNDFYSGATSNVITGSNMSGKTTFLRTLGLNTILAYAGSVVHAQSFQIGLMNIFTSMRIEDNVSEGISTFYAEILRIKQMVDFHKSKQPMLALIDEIFKGTNSVDRIMGASEMIRQLTSNNCITCITTHDYELCDLENDTDVHSKNYHFSEYYKDSKICFDYKIKQGRATTTNAQYLLKMVGIIRDDS